MQKHPTRQYSAQCIFILLLPNICRPYCPGFSLSRSDLVTSRNLFRKLSSVMSACSVRSPVWLAAVDGAGSEPRAGPAPIVVRVPDNAAEDELSHYRGI